MSNNRGQCNVFAQLADFGRSYEIHMAWSAHNTLDLCVPKTVEYEKISAGLQRPAFIQLSKEDARVLVDALIRAGVEPSIEVVKQEVMKAKDSHLQDLRDQNKVLLQMIAESRSAVKAKLPGV